MALPIQTRNGQEVAGHPRSRGRIPLAGADMDEKTVEMIETARKSNPEVNRLYLAHQELNRQVDDLNSRSHLSSEEEMQLHQLKKEKLRVRDRIEQIVHGRQSA
jgi:uncharacterized protein YdcH (DUF465 family)